MILKAHAMRGLSNISDLPCIDFEELPATTLPADFPDGANIAKFLYGDRVKWRWLSEEDE